VPEFVIFEKFSIPYGHVEVPKTFVADVASRIGLTGEIAEATRAQIYRLVQLALQNEKEYLSLAGPCRISTGNTLNT
jgi:hypothetical protein